jgi:hypothetical protein
MPSGMGGIVWGLLFWGCSDYSIGYEKVVIEYVYVEDTSTPVEDIAADDIWVDSFTQPSSSSGVDIVWVVDRSGSMNNNQAKLEAGFQAMLSDLNSSWDAMWRVAIISADSNAASNEQQFPLLFGDDEQDAMLMLNNTSGHREEGFKAFYSYYTGAYAQNWMRHEASLLVIFVSDEDDQSGGLFPYATDFVQWYSNLRSTVFLASIVVSTTDCEPLVGDRYMEATNHLQGVVVDICSDDWTPSVQDALQQIQPYDEWELSHVPCYGEQGIFVFIDGHPSSDWHYDSSRNVVVFDVIPDGDVLVEIAYEY